MIRALAVLAVVAGVLAAPADRPWAAQDDPRLDRLFADLRATDDAAEGARLGREIAAIWGHSGDPEVDAAMRQAEILLDVGNLHYASQRFMQITTLAPDFAAAWNKRAQVRYLLGDYAKAIAHIERTLELEPRHFLALAGLGAVYLRLGEDRLALAAFERALAINPHLTGTRQAVKELRARLGDGDA